MDLEIRMGGKKERKKERRVWEGVEWTYIILYIIEAEPHVCTLLWKRKTFILININVSLIPSLSLYVRRQQPIFFHFPAILFVSLSFSYFFFFCKLQTHSFLLLFFTHEITTSNSANCFNTFHLPILNITFFSNEPNRIKFQLF